LIGREIGRQIQGNRKRLRKIEGGGDRESERGRERVREREREKE